MKATELALLILRLIVASVWFYEGTWCKILWVHPNQLAIVELIGPVAGMSPAIFLRIIGFGETLIGLAVLLNKAPRLLASFQIFLVLTMNATAILSAFTALESPRELLFQNVPFFLAVLITGFCQPKRAAQINWERGALDGRINEPRILFGQVREDADVEVSLLPKLTADQRVLVIASGGCTAFAVASATSAHVTSIDINSAQIALCQLKARLIENRSREEYLDLLQHNGEAVLDKQDPDFGQRRKAQLKRGLNHCGRVDRALKYMVECFKWGLVPQHRINTLLSMNQCAEQSAYFQHYWKNWRWKLLFSMALHPRILSLFYGSRVRSLLPPDFGSQIQNKVERLTCAFPAQTNPYLWQTFAGRYRNNSAECLPVYLRPDNYEQLRTRSPILFETSEATEWLNQQLPASLHYFCLSNIFESMDEKNATQLWKTIERVAARNAIIITRFIVRDSRLFLPSDSPLHFLDDVSEASTDRDRSVICGNVRVFQKR